ncbi:MAG TPA: choice-of-anchor B family protein [Balneolaceae bacterium]|nr:choice-of-anchor B family protein [Balneolaceae bacterium]
MRRLLYTLPIIFTVFLGVPLQAQTTADSEPESLQGFARAVDVSGETIFIGEPANYHQPGIVYIYAKDGLSWAEQMRLQAPDGEIGNNFGSVLSADGEQLLVGAPGANEGNGAVYYYASENGVWNEMDILTTNSEESAFGSSVLLHGDHAYVGAPIYADGRGAVIVYRNNGGVWDQVTTISNPDTTGSGFGSTLAFDDEALVIGAPSRSGGSVFVFEESGSEWELAASLSSNQADERSMFGSVLNIRDGKVFVGAPRQNGAAGAVFIFSEDASGEWAEDGRLSAFDAQNWYMFGGAIEFTDGKAWIGAPSADQGRGAIYKFESDENGNWISSTKLMSDQGEGDLFAGTLAVEGDVAVAGLTGADYGAGSAAIMERDESGGWVTQQIVIGEGDNVLQPITGGRVECEDGYADIFGCENVDMISFLPISALGGDRGVQLNDMWGWTDEDTGKNYALVGRNNGTSFVDVTDPLNPVYIGDLPMTEGSRANVWRDMKVYSDHVFVVADNAGAHGVQVMDLTRLREFDGEPIIFDEDAIYRNVNSVHNIVINEQTGFAFAVGSSGGGETCGGGLHMINIQEPTNPTFAGCFADPSTGRSGTGYSHDAQCVIYEGPDEEHQGQEVCFGSNETAISIADVTDKENPIALSTGSYPDHAYVHQGWLTEDQRYFFQNDELDEISGNVEQTRTLIWDVSDLDDPLFVDEFFVPNPSSDHNLYIEGNTMYQSNYASGLQVIDITNPEAPQRVGYFDTHPFVEDAPGFPGTWSNFPYFDDIVLMTSSNEGLFILDANREN